MLTVPKEQKGDVTIIRLAGTIDEHVDLDHDLGVLAPKVEIICREIFQINSLGVKAWIDFFSKAASNRVRFAFAECPPPIVEQLNYITNFGCGGPVVSVFVPFSCEKCHRELRGVIKSDDLKKVSFKLPPIKCPKCNAKAHFDDIPEEYFAFLIRQGRAP